jgi:hypothetical protein
MATAAPCCSQALRDATTRWPNRNRASDGIMGDAAHQRRRSDHNDGNAFDLTHDPTHGVDCHVLSRQVINDQRVTYVIWNRQIYNRDRAAEGWRAYTGPNPHAHHMHVSIRATSRNDLAPWPWSPGAATFPSPPLPPASVLQHPPYPGTPIRHGSQNAHVRTVQQRLKDLGWAIVVDGAFGPKTHQTVVAFQRQKRLNPDGIVGPRTWAALWTP